MTIEQAIEILEHHQAWRMGEVDFMNFDPKQLTKALDVLLEFVKHT